jgi:hypothetical protein
VRKIGTFGLTEGPVALPAAPLTVRWSLAGLAGWVRAVRVQLLVLLAFLGLAVLLLGSIWTSPATRTLGAGVGDPGLFAWFLRWTPFAVGRHISPFASDYLNHPDGINLMWNTWMPLPGILLAPLTLLLGPVLTFNVLVTLAYGLSAWSAYLAIHRYVPSHGAAACGGLVYGFSPAMVGHSHHPNLILILLLPWLFVLLDEILDRQRRSPVWLGVGLGAVAAAQLLTGAEVFAGMVLLGLVLFVLLVAANRHSLRDRDRGLYAATALAVSVVVFELLVAWPLRAQIAGPARVHADLTEEVRGSSDLLALVTPSRLSAIAPEAAVRLGDQFTGTRETYLGIPLLLVVALVASRRRSPVVRVGAAMLVVCMVLSLGSRLRVGGLVTPVPLPWTVVESLPVLWHMVPARLALFTALFAGLLLAVALEDLWVGSWRRRVLAVVAAVLALAFLVPSAPLQSAPVVATPPFFTGPAVTTLPRDGVALVVPFPQKGRDNQAMVWQARAGMWFKMPGGYFVGPGPDGGTLREAPPTTTSRVLDRIRREGRPPDLTPALRRRIAADLARWRVASVVLGPMPHRRAMAGFLTDLLGRPPEPLAGVDLWRDATVAPARAAQTPESRSSPPWAQTPR